MSLSQLLTALPNKGTGLSDTAWAAAEELRGSKVQMFRDYADGDHTDNTNAAQKNLLNQSGRNSEDSHPFNDNLCPVIIDTMLDRIQLTNIQASAESDTDAEAQNKWIKKYLQRNRFDALQVDVHESTARDGNSYLMCYPDLETGEAKWSSEPAYDGNFGTVLRYATTASKEPLYAIKTWKTSSTTVADTIRVDVYYPDRIERFVGSGAAVLGSATALQEYTGDNQPAVMPWLDKQGQPLGVPFVHFKNRGGSVDNFGLSELENVVPLQDAHNTILISMVATALLLGFPIRGLVGDDAKKFGAVTPGLMMSFFAAGADGVARLPDAVTNEWLKSIRLEQYEGADLTQFIAQADWLKQEMYTVTNTPTDDVAADASGEARKQSEVKLIGKVKRFQTRNGNAWEDAIRMAARVDRAFNPKSEAPEAFEELTAEWMSPEVRNDSKVLEDIRADYRDGIIPLTMARKLMQPIRGWSDADLEQMIKDDEEARNQAAEDQANAADAAMVDGVLSGMKKAQAKAVMGGDSGQAAAA